MSRIPAPTITFSFQSLTEAREWQQRITTASLEGVEKITFSSKTEEYWPDKFTTVHTVTLVLARSANIQTLTDELEALLG